MKAFGFLSFGHYGHGRGPGDPDARQAAAPIPLLSAAGARTQRIEVGTGVIDMR